MDLTTPMLFVDRGMARGLKGDIEKRSRYKKGSLLMLNPYQYSEGFYIALQ